MDGAKYGECCTRTSQSTNKLELEVFQHGSDRKHQTRYYEIIAWVQFANISNKLVIMLLLTNNEQYNNSFISEFINIFLIIYINV